MATQADQRVVPFEDKRARPSPGRDFVAEARAMAPALRARMFEADANRRLDDALIAEMIDRGILQMLAPRRFGGGQAGQRAFLDTGLEVARGCGAAGWLFGVLGCHHWVLGHFPLAAQQELYGERDHALWPFTFSGKGGTARPAEGGWIVSGHWGFCSGIDFSDWVGVSATIDKPDADDLHDRIALILPAAEVEVIDSWHVAGMRGTGSRDIVVREVFVPAHRSIPQLALQNCDSPGRQALPEMPELAAPFYAVLLNAVLSTMLGMAAACLDDFIAFTRDRKGFRGIDHASRASTQELIGRAETEWEAAVTLARAMYDEIDRRCAEGRDFPVEDRLRYRRNAVWIGERAVGIVNDLVAAAGARAQHMTSAFQLIQRNMLTIRTHVVMDASEAMEAYGRHRLAGDLKTLRY